MSIAVRGVCKRFGEYVALDNVSLDVPEGRLIALLGPSGSGKTTLLRVIAGLETPDSGGVLYRGIDVTHTSARERNIGFVFQHFALFRHMTVSENVAFGLRVRHVARAQIKQRVRELLKLVRLDGLRRRYPSQLSGGQRQRVALARAMAAAPQVLLLDEPFGALDAKVRQELRQWLRRLHDETKLTSLFVTHDQEEAFEVADVVVIVNAGKIEQIGTPQEIFDHPANAFVMDFLGKVNVFHGRVEAGKALFHGMEIAYPEYPHSVARPATGYVRPHELEISRQPDRQSCLEAKVTHLYPTGPILKVQLLALAFGALVSVDVPAPSASGLALRVGEVVYIAPKRVRVFVPDYQAPDYSI